jgi:threonine synthase
MVLGWVCRVCGAEVDVARSFSWTCPSASPDDPRHVLRLVDDGAEAEVIDDPNPFVRFARRMAWFAFAVGNGMSEAAALTLARSVADGFSITPFAPNEAMSDHFGVEVWVKDETGQLAGSHKARHLVSVMLHLRVAEELGLLGRRPPLAISSCGNAALAASTLAARESWPIEVFVPTWMDPAFGSAMDALGASVHRCERRPGDPPGDPAMAGFRSSVDAGAVPFSVQGPVNAWCLDGGRTIGWEMAEVGAPVSELVVQVGGGALASCAAQGLGGSVSLLAVQAEGCAPLDRAVTAVGDDPDPASRWEEVMTPWQEPRSLADGILDDETYDWLAVLEAMRVSGGRPVVVSEASVVEAVEVARSAGLRVSPTGAAGVAALIEGAQSGPVAVIASGVDRSGA